MYIGGRMVRALTNRGKPAMFATTETLFRTVAGAFGTALCAGVCLLGATAPAEAAPAARVQAVRYADLNLADAGGRSALDARIKQAARAVCSTGSADLRARTEEARCIRAAVAAGQSRAAVVG